jgi:predicted dienelactone hydrolase
MKTTNRIACAVALIGFVLTAHSASVIQFTGRTFDVMEGAAAAQIIVQRTNDLERVVTVDFATTNLTATPGVDYLDVATTLTFQAGETDQIVAVPILNDAEVELRETFQAILKNPGDGAALGAWTTATVRIDDNDVGAQVEYANYQVREDEAFVMIAVVRGDDGESPVSVDFNTADGSALAGQDYVSTNGTLEITARDRPSLLIIPILNDGVRESNKTFQFQLSDPTGIKLGPTQSATITLIDNDPGVEFEFSQYWVQENDATLSIRVLRGSDVDLPPFTVNFATSDLSAIAGHDYTVTRGTLTFAEGELVKTVTVPITNDEQPESDETCALNLSDPSEGVLLGSKAIATNTILDATGMSSHRFDGLTLLPDGSAQLMLGGGVHERFRPYFDLYPIEVSSNLLDWTPLMTLVQSNASTNALVLNDRAVNPAETRFYRTPSRHFIAPLMKPTGPFPAGVVSRVVTDPNRRNRYRVSTNGSFAVSIWYPAVHRSGVLPAPLEDPRLARDPNWPSWSSYGNVGQYFKDREPHFVSHALPDVECAATAAPYPVLVYSPGGWGNRTETAGRGPELASHGYIVVTGDPEDVYASAFPDGRYLYGNDALVDSRRGFESRVRDLQLILDELDRWNRSDPVLAGRLQVTNVASVGWSWGGGVAAELCRVDARCRATIILEGYFQNAGTVLGTGLHKPMLSMYRLNPPNAAVASVLHEKAMRDSIWFQILGANHDVFGDTYWALGGYELGQSTARIIDTYVLWFLNKYLKEIDELVPSTIDFPDIVNFQQK